MVTGLKFKEWERTVYSGVDNFKLVNYPSLLSIQRVARAANGRGL